MSEPLATPTPVTQAATEHVELGFAEEPDSFFASEPFPNQIGGHPTWLDPTQPLSADRVLCGACDTPMPLLMQLYTPEDEPREAFHRMVYVFCCKNGNCHAGNSFQRCFKVFRSQLPETNPYYTSKPAELSPAPSDEENSDDEDQSEDDIVWTRNPDCKPANLCVVCGLAGSKACSRCKSTHYCSRQHQIADWRTGNHRTQCATSTTATPPPTPATATPDTTEPVTRLQAQLMFPLLEIVSEPEALDTHKNRDDAEMEAILQRVDMDTELDTQEDLEDSETAVDRAFLEFQKRTNHNPSQVLRYVRTMYDRDDNVPLFVSDADKPHPGDIALCEQCGSPRSFEFQILPQLLYYLGTNDALPASLDWGSLFIYSCPKNCLPSHAAVDGESPKLKTTDNPESFRKQPYIQEVLWRQHFTKDGIGRSFARPPPPSE
ncbi:hypothetical protein H4R33_004767 [Dimargaris cristalligena]|uniref:Programmed cell death protein 2 n=1 Tax=Dimargaris cristalligena TaxID=215637 RepID=A0A4P9ZUS8_9FUNG|nr:hypothetical protein H4R33_004767 [Dimargaris cristalligena]RKP37334.1 programmed cell death protein 2 [Dimargaris cristalligena]|eukprot:RKP37334.1 programmed cell death protein 2 [Dimargaris cristalligena]